MNKFKELIKNKQIQDAFKSSFIEKLTLNNLYQAFSYLLNECSTEDEFKQIIWLNYIEKYISLLADLNDLRKLAQICIEKSNFLLLDNVFFIMLSILIKKNEKTTTIDQLIELFKDYEHNILILIEIKKWTDIYKQFYDNINQIDVFLFAAKHAGAEIFDILDTYGLIEHQVDENEDSALHIAALNNNPKFIEHFIKRIDVNIFIDDIKSFLIENNKSPTDAKLNEIKSLIAQKHTDEELYSYLNRELSLDKNLSALIYRKRRNYRKLKYIFHQCFDKKLIEYSIKHLDCFKPVFYLDYDIEAENKQLDSIYGTNIAALCYYEDCLETFKYFVGLLKPNQDLKHNKRSLVLKNMFEVENGKEVCNVLKYCFDNYDVKKVIKVLNIFFELNSVYIENIHDKSLNFSQGVLDAMENSVYGEDLYNLFEILIFSKNELDKSLVDYILSNKRFVFKLIYFKNYRLNPKKIFLSLFC